MTGEDETRAAEGQRILYVSHASMTTAIDCVQVTSPRGTMTAMIT